MRRALGILVSLAVLASVVVLAALAWVRLDLRPRTDDAYLQADLVHMAPDVGGRMTRLDIVENQRVHRGDQLFVIDQEPYRLRAEQARARLTGLEAQLATDVGQVASQGSRADAASTSVRAAQAQLALARTTQLRLEPLGAQGYVSMEQVDRARTATRTAAVELESSRQQAQGARQAVTSTRPLEEQIVGTRAELALAERDLRLTVVRAPCDGQVTALDVAAGEFVAVGRPVFTIIDTERWWAVGNFRETNLAGLRPGLTATVYLSGSANLALRGTVESLGGGVTPDEGATTGGLPRVPRSLNWVRIAQRFPVRILLADPPAELMRIGATVTVTVER